MPRRLTRAIAAMSGRAAVLAWLGIVVGAAGPASASVTWPAARGATPACLVLPSCVSLYQFSLAGSAQLVLEATGGFSNAPLIQEANDPTDLNQDWTYIDLGTVRRSAAEGLRTTLGLTGFDLANYGGDEMYQLEFSPAGLPSGFCAANVADVLRLRACNGSRFQTLISASDIAGTWRSPPGYFYGLSAVQAPVAAHHLAVTGSRLAGARVTLSRPVLRDSQFWQPS